jgi:type II secretory pathway component PulF
MKSDELAFFNQQLAVMLRDGIPLEGALKQLTRGMRAGPLRAEIQDLEADLAKGTPLKEALSKRNLPPFYVRMVQTGAVANELPGMLTLLADHYHRAHALWTRLKGLMVYPLIVILVSLGLSVVISAAFTKFAQTTLEFNVRQTSRVLVIGLWLAPGLLAVAAIALIAALSVPGFRSWLRWRLPAFREASLSQLGAAMALMLRNGTTLPDALALAESLESDTPAARALARWRAQIAEGKGKPADWQDPTSTLPPLFLWLIKSAGEDPAAGFQKASDLYQARATYRTELLLYGALPVSILILGQLVFWQMAPMFQALVNLMNMIGDVS